MIQTLLAPFRYHQDENQLSEATGTNQQSIISTAPDRAIAQSRSPHSCGGSYVCLCASTYVSLLPLLVAHPAAAPPALARSLFVPRAHLAAPPPVPPQRPHVRRCMCRARARSSHQKDPAITPRRRLRPLAHPARRARRPCRPYRRRRRPWREKHKRSRRPPRGRGGGRRRGR